MISKDHFQSSSYNSLAEYIVETCRLFSERPAFINFGTSLTYKDLEEKSRYFAAYLQQELQLKQGERVAVMMPNLLQYPIAVAGILRAGLVVVNVNPRYTADELEHQLNDSGAVGIVVLNIAHHTLQHVLPKVSLKYVITTQLGDLLSFPRSFLLNIYLRSVKHHDTVKLEGALEFESVLEQGQHLSFEKPILKGEDLAFLQYTGGTTGVAKGAMLTQQSLLANIAQMQEIFMPHVREHECVATVLPLYHIFALTVNYLTFLGLGFPNLLITDPTKIRSLIHELGHHPITVFLGLNTLFNALVQHPDFKKLDFSKWHLTVAGGMATHPRVAARWEEIVGIPVIEGYGLTEASPVVSVNPLNQKPRAHSIGLSLPRTEVSIRDEEGSSVPPGQHGELWIRGPQVMKGYWQQPAETQHVLTKEGWLKTGDIGYLDPEGYLFLIDRKKEMMLVSGFNVYPSEVEHVLSSFPGVKEVAVIGIPDEVAGERIKAVIAPQPGIQLDESSLRTYCHEHLVGYKVPKVFEFREILPKSNVGKVLKRALF